VFITIKSVEAEAHDGKFTFGKLFTNEIFFTLIVSLLSTYVLWIFISLVFFDPWHIVTSVASLSPFIPLNLYADYASQSLQYLLLSPTYTNVINVYAFCNTHDVTWGTKGDDKAPALKTATVNAEGKSDQEPNFNDADLDELYSTALQKFASEAVEEPQVRKPEDIDEGYRKAFRTYVVLVWMFCNAALVAVVLNAGGLARLQVSPTTGTETESAKVKTYLLIVLWSVAGLSAFKFVGAMWYKVHRIVSSSLI
jgi:chitin synthase